MLKGKHRLVVAAVLVGAALFSPLLCGMPCLEAPVEKTIAAPAAGEFMGEFAESGLVRCVLTQVVLSIDWSDWADVVQAGAWVWVGFKAVRLIEGNLPQGLPWK